MSHWFVVNSESRVTTTCTAASVSSSLVAFFVAIFLSLYFWLWHKKMIVPATVKLPYKALISLVVFPTGDNEHNVRPI